MTTRGMAFTLFWVAVGLALPPPASAYEGQNTLEGGAAYTAMPGDNGAQHFMGIDLAVGFGLGDAWSLRVSGAFAMGLVSDHQAADALARVGVEAIYLVDIVQLVPYLGVGIAAELLIGDDVSPHSAVASSLALHPALLAVVGLDYLLNRSIFIGAAYRMGWLPLYSERAGSPLHHSVDLRVGWRWDR